MKTLLFLLCCAVISSPAFGQKTVFPELATDGPITKLEYSPSIGLLMAGNFQYIGHPAKNIALVDNNTGEPIGRTPYLETTNDVSNGAIGREVIADGNGGWYVNSSIQLYSYGQFNYRPQHIWYDSTNQMRTFDCITHLNADNSIDTVFRINSSQSTYRIISLKSVVLYKSMLYAWCDLADQSGAFYRRKLLGINARTGVVEWDPNTNHRTDEVMCDLAVLGRNLFVVGRMNVINGQPATRYSLAYNLDNRQLTGWNPLNNTDFECGGCSSEITGYGNRLVIAANLFNGRKELIGTDTTSSVLWRKSTSGLIGKSVIDASTGYYYTSPGPFYSNIIKIRLTDGATLRSYDYPVFQEDRDTNSIYVGAIKKLSLEKGRLYLFGDYILPDQSKRFGLVQVDTATFRPTKWKPFNEREPGVIESSWANNKHRAVTALGFQGDKIFISGIFELLKLQFAPSLAAIDPIAGTLRWRPRASPRDVDYFLQIGSLAADGDSLVWISQNSRIRGFDARTGFKVRDFDCGSSVSIRQIIPDTDKLLLQGYFQQIRGMIIANGFAATTKNGDPYAWEPIFPNSSGGRIDKIALQGDNIYLGGQFVANNGSKNLAIINRSTGNLTEWKTQMPNNSSGYEYVVKDIVPQGNELFTVDQDRGYNWPGEYRKISLTTGKVTANYSYTTCQASEQLLAKDKYIFINERYCTPYTRESFSYFDQSNNKFIGKPLLPKFSFQEPGSILREYVPNPQGMRFIGNTLFYASNYEDGNGPTSRLAIPRLMTMRFPKGFFNETVDYFPKSGGNAGTVTVNFYGTSLAIGSKVKLTRAGQAPITVPDSTIKYPEAFRIETTFDLRGKMVSTWNIEITTPTGESIVIPNGFTINQAKPANIQLMLNAPTAYRPGAPTKVIISVANGGDKDAWAVPVYIITSIGTKVNLTTRVVVNDVSIYRDTAYQFNVTERGINEKGIWLQIAKLSAGKIFTIPLTLTDVSGRDITVRVYQGKPLTDVAPSSEGQLTHLSNKILQTSADPFNDIDPEEYNTGKLLKPAVDCAFDAVSDNTGTPIDNIILDGVRGKVVPTDIGEMVEDAYSDDEPDIGDMIDDILDFKNPFKPDIPDSCDPFKPEKKTPVEGTIPSVRSSDPNDKLGPIGTNRERYISGKDLFSYIIRFENDTTATANAQIVRLIDTLDRTKYDYSTFQLGFFNVADTTFFIPPGRKHYSIDWDLRPTKNLVLRMEARFNDTTGVLKSTYIALDPVTMELTEDVFAGFLPPNYTAPEGEGSLGFSIRVKDDLSNLTSINNKAHIYFDYNPPIPTPAWINTIDKGLPVSTMKPLPSISTSTTMTLGWRGTDNESGPKLYDIYVSVNGGAYKQLVSATGDSTFRYVGKPDSTYRFYSVAYDSVYNQEPAPLTFDTETFLQTRPVESIRSGNWNDPATWSCNCVPTDLHRVTIKPTHIIYLNSAMASAFCSKLMLAGKLSIQGGSIYVNGVRLAIN